MEGVPLCFVRPIPVSTTVLRGGDPGVRDTLDNMRRLADYGSRDPQVRGAVLGAIRDSGVIPHDIPGQVNAWYRFVRDRITFVNDPVGAEYLQAPSETLRIAGGDCDDRAILLAAGLRGIGVPAAFKVTASDRSRPRTMSHVYVVANLLGRPLALDPTYPMNRPGSEPPFIGRAWLTPAFPAAPWGTRAL